MKKKVFDFFYESKLYLNWQCGCGCGACDQKNGRNSSLAKKYNASFCN